jgi:hypothetical protein
MLRPEGGSSPADVETTNRIARSFLAVRIVRGSLLVLFFSLVLGAVVAEQWPTGVTVTVAVAVGLQVARLALNVRRYRQTSTPQS